MDIVKQIKTCLILLFVTSCSHIKLETPKNDVIDTIEYKGQKYLIPIPKGYCNYNSKDKGDKAVINFLNDFHKVEEREIVALYEESCDVKQKVINGDLRDSPRSIEIDVGFKDIEYDTRQEFVDFLYKNTPKRSNPLEEKKSLTKIYENTTEEKLLKYGFSKKRSDILREDYKGYAERNNTKRKLEKDDNGFYLFYFGSSNNFSSYSVQSFTKIYNKSVSVIITRTLDDVSYNRSIAKQIMDEAKSYMKELVLVNDKNDYREYGQSNQKIKLFRPKGFIAPSKLTKTLTESFNKISFLNPKDRNFKESFLISSNGETIKIGISLPNSNDINNSYLASKENYTDVSYNLMRNSFPSRSFNASKEQNSAFFMMCDDNNICADDSDKHEVVFLVSTLIKKTPVMIIAEITTHRDKKPIKPESIESLKKDIINYIDFLDQNQ